jgi:hypothetical protein
MRIRQFLTIGKIAGGNVLVLGLDAVFLLQLVDR